MVRRLGLGKNNHLTYASLALNPRYAVSEGPDQQSVQSDLGLRCQCLLTEALNTTEYMNGEQRPG